MRAVHYPRADVDKWWISFSFSVDKRLITFNNNHLQNVIYPQHLWISLYKYAKYELSEIA